jgi:hypothetical protein
MTLNLDDLLKDAGFSEDDLSAGDDLTKDSGGPNEPLEHKGESPAQDSSIKGGGKTGKEDTTVVPPLTEGEGASSPEDADADAGKESTEPSDTEMLKTELARLKDELRDAKRDLRAVKKTAASRGDDDAEEPSDEEIAALQRQQTLRAEELETYKELMTLNPKYSDFDSVVNKSSVGDFVDAVATALAKKEGIRFDEAVENVEEFVWTKKNPWRFLYDQIKPVMAKAAGEKTAEKGKAPATPEEKEALKERQKKTAEEAAKAPGNVSGAPGEGSTGATYTSAMLDDMTEAQLDKVPASIVDKWLAGMLK